jgi:hypothetical protein
MTLSQGGVGVLNRIPVVVALCVVALLPLAVSAALAAEQVPADVANAAVTYANALAAGNTQAAWNLLSAKSRTGTDVVKWQQAFEEKAPVSKPPATSVLRALASGESPPVPGEVLVRPNESFIEVKSSIEILRDLVLVKEKDGWRVDLASSDQLNSRQAASDFLGAIREEPASAQARGVREAGAAALRVMLASEAKDYKVIKGQVTGDRAEVTVAASVPVNLVMRAVRLGAGWAVDVARPVLPIDVTSPNPLQEAVGLSDRTACEDQLRQLVRAIQLYASSSDDLLPDAAHWYDKIRQYLPPQFTGHCPQDPSPGLSYAFNANLGGKRVREVANPALVPMFFESKLHTRNPADTGQSWAEPRHPGGNLVAFADGSTRPVSQPPSFEVKPAPPGAPRISGPSRPQGTRPLGPGMQPQMRRQPGPPAAR